MIDLGPDAVTLSAQTYDRFHDAYVALLEALTEARACVEDQANPTGWSMRPTDAQKLLERIDAALAMKANLKERT